MAEQVLFCFGGGFTARVLAERLLAKGWTVRGTARSRDRMDQLLMRGIEPHLFDGRSPIADAGEALLGVTHVLHSIPPDGADDPVLAQHESDLRALPDLRWLGWLGTTSVYGDRDGGWVDENTPPLPNLGRGDRRAVTEQLWLNSGLPTQIFRLAGIYGPGRNPFINLRDGSARRIIKPGQVFSRIHVEDIARVLEASMDRPDPGRIYNVCDDEPAPPQDIVTYAAELMRVNPPPAQPFETADISPMARSFYAANRRVRNDRIKAELGVKLAYPTYREGLRALLPIDGA